MSASSTPEFEPMDLASVGRVEPERFGPRELSEVCARYELGQVTSIREFRRGSPAAPKVVIEAARGKFLLKRRSPRTGDPFRVAFVHGIQLYLHAHGYPTPAIIGTRDDNNSILQRDGMVYELFRFVEGEPPSGRDGEVAAAGGALGRLHRLIAGHRPAWEGGATGWRVGFDLEAALAAAVERVPETAEQVARIRRPAAEAGAALDHSDLAARPMQIIHGDWHPGNLIMRDGAVAAVLDFDSARYAPPLVELANGLLQFSMTRVGPDPAAWPYEPDEKRLILFWNAYSGEEPNRTRTGDAELVPWLMIELLVAEAVRPIVETGRFGHLDAVTCLRMVDRKCAWLRENAASMSGRLRIQ
jgi:aminoglycoside phosphotransferase (APT) family kinase protein